jgi:hypothetical protein
LKRAFKELFSHIENGIPTFAEIPEIPLHPPLSKGDFSIPSLYQREGGRDFFDG